MGKAILLIGEPGCGKTTLILRLIDQLSGLAGGFYTQELRVSGVRQGFEIITLDGSRGILAHVDIHGFPRVGKYGVNIAAINELAVSAIRKALPLGGIVVIDEIGPMEITSAHFRQAVLDALQSQSIILGTIYKRSTPFTDQIKRQTEVSLIEVRPENRNNLFSHVLALLKKQ